jgi:putative peptidoglycan lipid II flippase
VFNVILLVALGFVARESDEVWITIWLAIAIVFAGFAQLLIAVIALVAGTRWQRIRVRTPDQTGAFFKRALPGLIATGIPQLKLIAATAIASASPAAVSWLYYANRLYELPLGVASVVIAAAIVPRISADIHADGNASSAQSRAYEIALGIALPAAAGFALLASPIAGGLFERGAFTATDTAAVAAALAAISAGLPGHALEKVFGAVSFAHEDTYTPMLSALCGLAAAIIGGLLLFPRYGHVGIAAAIAISAWAGAALLGVILYRRRWLRLDSTAMRRLPRIIVATAAMAAAVIMGLIATHALDRATAWSAPGRFGILIVLVALGVATYAAVLHALGVANFRDFATALRTRK